MGLDFRFQGDFFDENEDWPHVWSDAHWSYHGFDVFRDKLANVIGIDLEEMQGHGGVGKWASVQDDIVPLLNHSDCDGELSPDDCAAVAPRLRQLIADWPDDSYDKIHAVYLAISMERCAKKRVNLEFC